MAVQRVITPTLNPAGLTTAGMAVYAAAVMIANAVHHHGIIDPPVIVAAVGAVAALLTRQVVTPVADPRDGNGTPLLVQAGALPPGTVPVQPVVVVPQGAADETLQAT